MSRAGFTANKALFRVIGGRRATVETDEAYNAKSRCHVLPLPDARHRKAFLRDLVPDRAAAIDSGARVFPRAGVAPRDSQLRTPDSVVRDAERPLGKLEERDAEVIALAGFVPVLPYRGGGVAGTQSKHGVQALCRFHRPPRAVVPGSRNVEGEPARSTLTALRARRWGRAAAEEAALVRRCGRARAGGATLC